MRACRAGFVWLGVLAGCAGAAAQDLRSVAAPVPPPVGVVLTARLAARDRSLAEADEDRPDTSRIQAALDRCPRGEAVELAGKAAANAFLIGPIELRAGVCLLIDRDVTVFASRNPRDYDLRPGVAGTLTEFGHGCRPLIRADHADHVAIMGDGVIDGRGGARLHARDVTWWQVAAEGRPHALQNNPRLIVFANCDDVVVAGVQLRDSPNFHLSFSGGNGITVWGVTINAPANAHNADGIDIGQPWPAADRPTTNVTVAHCFVHAGDDIVALKSIRGFPTSHVSVLHNHFYTGHGMSIGSATAGGIFAVRVRDLTIDGAATAVHLKSNVKLGGWVRDVAFEDVAIRNSRNPLTVETHYDSSGHEVDGDKPDFPPRFEEIRFSGVTIAGGGRILLDGLDEAHPLQIDFRAALLDQPGRYRISARHARLRLEGSNFSVTGEDVVIAPSGVPGPFPDLGARFAPFPFPVSRVVFRPGVFQRTTDGI